MAVTTEIYKIRNNPVCSRVSQTSTATTMMTVNQVRINFVPPIEKLIIHLTLMYYNKQKTTNLYVPGFPKYSLRWQQLRRWLSTRWKVWQSEAIWTKMTGLRGSTKQRIWPKWAKLCPSKTDLVRKYRCENLRSTNWLWSIFGQKLLASMGPQSNAFDQNGQSYAHPRLTWFVSTGIKI